MPLPNIDSNSAWSTHLRSARLRKIVTLGVVSVLVVAALAMGLPVVLSPPRSVVIAPRETSQPAAVGNLTSALVHLVGAVAKPGLISVASGARVIDAVMSAGGLLSAADQCAVNLARTINDGEQIIIPYKKPHADSCLQLSNEFGAAAGSGANVGSGGGKVSLSRATLEQLDGLPGVGPALAQRIIDWRVANGGFQSVSQLDNVSGIGVKLMATLKPLIVP
ncbi:MAG: hypothetical protein RLZZ600_1350 [Actinomycetota bacterium]|jgi:competence protein ComEA